VNTTADHSKAARINQVMDFTSRLAAAVAMLAVIGCAPEAPAPSVPPVPAVARTIG
jgi:hypothetical protein